MSILFRLWEKKSSVSELLLGDIDDIIIYIYFFFYLFFFFFFISKRKSDLTFHVNHLQFTWNVLFSLKSKEKYIYDVVCCSCDWHFKGWYDHAMEIFNVHCLDLHTNCNVQCHAYAQRIKILADDTWNFFTFFPPT